jgi:hypothetical protein
VSSGRAVATFELEMSPLKKPASRNKQANQKDENEPGNAVIALKLQSKLK